VIENTKMSSMNANAHLIWPLLMQPTLAVIQKHNPRAAQNLATALGKAENTEPGLLLELVSLLLSDPNLSTSSSQSASLTEALLRAQSVLSADASSANRKIVRAGGNARAGNIFHQTHALKQLLARIPTEINQRSVFLLTIKEIASAIKRVLDAVDQAQLGDRTVEQRKRQLVRDSKTFSQTLKDYFKGDAEPETLFTSSVQLLYDLNMLEKATFGATTTSSIPIVKRTTKQIAKDM